MALYFLTNDRLVTAAESAKNPAPAANRPNCRSDLWEKNDRDSEGSEVAVSGVRRGRGCAIVGCWRNAMRD